MKWDSADIRHDSGFKGLLETRGICSDGCVIIRLYLFESITDSGLQSRQEQRSSISQFSLLFQHQKQMF